MGGKIQGDSADFCGGLGTRKAFRPAAWVALVGNAVLTSGSDVGRGSGFDPRGALLIQHMK